VKGAGDGSRSPALCGDGHLEEGREGLFRVAGVGRRKTVETVTTWGSMTSQILALCEHLATEQVSCVVMEATGEYWKPFYYLLEGLPAWM